MNKPKILDWDTETSPNTVYSWGLFKQNIPADRVIETSRLMCVCARWSGESKVIQLAEWDYKDRNKFLMDVFKLLDEADAVVSYNGKRFDTKVVMREFAEHLGKRPAPFHEVDLFETVRSNFRFTSNKLDHVSKRLLGEQKIKHEGFQLWVDCMHGNEKAQRKMLRYCAQDVKLLRPLRHKLMPWIHVNFAQGLESEVPVCPSCGSHHMQKRGYYTTKVSKFQRFECQDCGKWTRGKKSVLHKEQRDNTLVSLA